MKALEALEGTAGAAADTPPEQRDGPAARVLAVTVLAGVWEPALCCCTWHGR